MNAITTMTAQATNGLVLNQQLSAEISFSIHDDGYTLSSPARTVNYFNHDYIRPISRVIDGNNVSEKWFIRNESDTDWVEIDPDQLWFWTKEWQEGEKQVDTEREQGGTKRFKSVDDLISFLNVRDEETGRLFLEE